MRYVVVLIIGLIAGAMLALFWANLDRAQGAYPRGVMAAMQHHYEALRRSLADPGCPTTRSAHALARLRSLGEEVPAAFIEPRNAGEGFIQRHDALMQALDKAVAAPPADCVQLNALVRDLGDQCEACHLEHR